jgi:hypothetical protein
LPDLDLTRLFISLTAGAGTRCISLLSSSPSLFRAQRGSRNGFGEEERERRRRNNFSLSEFFQPLDQTNKRKP